MGSGCGPEEAAALEKPLLYSSRLLTGAVAMEWSLHRNKLSIRSYHTGGIQFLKIVPHVKNPH